MTHDEFANGFERLVSAFSVNNAEKKSSIYFDELKNVDNKTWQACVLAWVRRGHKFPTIADLLEVSRSMEPQEANTPKAACSFCDGYGWVFIEGLAYRGDCAHGNLLSGKIKQAPRDFKVIPMGWEGFYDWAVKNPKAAVKGFSFTSKILKLKNPEKYREVKNFLIELAGKGQAAAWAKESKGPLD